MTPRTRTITITELALRLGIAMADQMVADHAGWARRVWDRAEALARESERRSAAPASSQIQTLELELEGCRRAYRELALRVVDLAQALGHPTPELADQLAGVPGWEEVRARWESIRGTVREMRAVYGGGEG